LAGWESEAMINKIVYSYLAFLFGSFIIPFVLIASGLSFDTLGNLIPHHSDRMFLLALDLLTGVFFSLIVYLNFEEV
jgi:hypothetical protein